MSFEGELPGAPAPLLPGAGMPPGEPAPEAPEPPAATETAAPATGAAAEPVGPVPLIGVVTFPGSCDDRDAVHAIELVGARAIPLWHGEDWLDDVDGVVIPGGFSYGDYLRCGAIARFSPVMQAVRRFAETGGAVLGICNGFQVLCEAGLLPGVLRPNHHGRFVCRDVDLVVAGDGSLWTAGLPAGAVLRIPVKHHDGAWYAPEPLLEEVEAGGQVVLRYVENPNGSLRDVAGVANAAGNVFGLMPHPEHAVDELLGATGGRALLEGLLALAAARRALKPVAASA
jgi:phosphoribosylformylglycinamidine synthase